jgi:hypothetical protein
MRVFLGALLLVLLLVSCDQEPPPPTPTRVITGPTLEPSPVILPLIPTLDAFEPGQSDLTAASLPRGAELPPLAQGTRVPGAISQGIAITLPNGAQHPGELYTPADVLLPPGVLLLSPDPAVWFDLAARLRLAGMTALVTTMPQNATIADFDALISSLGETSDPGHIAVVGIGAGADAGLVGCSAVLQCDAAALIRPTSSTLINAMQGFNPRPLFVAARQDNADAYALASSLVDTADGQKQLYPMTADELDLTMQQALITWLLSQLA